MGQVSLTPVTIGAHQPGYERDFVTMTTVVDDNVEFVDVPTDVDMSGIDLDPVEIYQNLETAAVPQQNFWTIS